MAAGTPAQFDKLFNEACNAGDIESLLELYTEDATFIAEPGSAVVGKRALRDALSTLLTLNSPIELRTKNVVEGPALATIYTTWTLAAAGPDGASVDLGGESTVVVAKQSDGTWLAAIDDPWSKG